MKYFYLPHCEVSGFRIKSTLEITHIPMSYFLCIMLAKKLPLTISNLNEFAIL